MVASSPSYCTTSWHWPSGYSHPFTVVNWYLEEIQWTTIFRTQTHDSNYQTRRLDWMVRQKQIVGCHFRPIYKVTSAISYSYFVKPNCSKPFGCLIRPRVLGGTNGKHDLRTGAIIVAIEPHSDTETSVCPGSSLAQDMNGNESRMCQDSPGSLVFADRLLNLQHPIIHPFWFFCQGSDPHNKDQKTRNQITIDCPVSSP